MSGMKSFGVRMQVIARLVLCAGLIKQRVKFAVIFNY